MPDVGLCIPVFNEREALGGLLDRVEAALDGIRWTACLVDDGSTDGSVELVRGRIARGAPLHLLQGRKERKGCLRGRASRRGLEWLVSHTDHTVFADLDADGSQRPEELPAGIARVAPPVDVVVASKYVPGSRVEGRPLGRRLGSRGFSLLLRALMRPGLHDYSNSYRFYSRRAAEALLRWTPRYDSPVHLLEMLAVWLANGFVVAEMPTVYDERRGGASKVVARDVVEGVRGALDVALGFRTGRYRLAGAGGATPPR